MKRTTTLLALVALLLAFLGLQSVQGPAHSPRKNTPRSSRAARVEYSTRETLRSRQPGVKTASIPIGQLPEGRTAAPDSQSAGSVDPEPAQGKADPTASPANEPSNDSGDPQGHEAQAKTPPTAEELELGASRKGNGSLNWLRDHQCEDGHWSASDFGAASLRKDARHTCNIEFFAPGLDWADRGQSPENDLALTALALLSHVGAGFDHREGEYKESIRRAILWMRKQQAESGRFGPERETGFLPTHALCTAALAECYSMSGDRALQSNCERAAKYLLSTQTEGSGFARWPGGFGVDAEPDLATTAWSALALKSARMAGIELDLRPCAEALLKFLDSVTTVLRDDKGKITSITTRLRASSGDTPECRAEGFVALPTLDAMNAYCRCLFADEKQPEVTHALALKCAENAPAWEADKIDFTYWYFATSATFIAFASRPYGSGSKEWSEWEKAIAKVLMDNQRGFKADERKTRPSELDEFGSWDAVDAYSRQGGRVYTTAMAGLILEIYFRYARIKD